MLDGPAARVMKTAPFTDDRRLGVAWIGTRRDDRDDGPFQWGGNVVFRELIQHADGSLGVKFPDEMIPAGEILSALHLSPLGAGASVCGCRVHAAARQGLAVAVCSGIPRHARLVIRVNPLPDAPDFGLRLRAADTFDSGCDLRFSPGDGTVTLGDQWISGVDGLDRPFALEIALQDDIIDVCIDRRRTLIDRCPEQHGDRMFLYGQDSDVAFEIIEIAALP